MYLAQGLFQIAKSTNKPIVLSGGVSYNKIISEFMTNQGVLINKEVPCGDSGISYGQSYLANLLNHNFQ